MPPYHPTLSRSCFVPLNQPQKYAKQKKLFDPIPEMIKFPQLEIKLFLILCTGMLDVAFGVLTTTHTRLGWKLIAVIYIVIVVTFISWFVIKRRAFKKNTAWYPLANLLTTRKVDREDPSTFVSREDLIEVCKEVGLPVKDAQEFYKSMDFDDYGIVSYAEFCKQFKVRSIAQLVVTAADA